MFRIKASIVIVSVISAVGTVLLFIHRTNNPFSQIEFLEDLPGATDRYVTFTPVLRTDHTKVVGETVGADFGKLHFRDCDGDGIDEAVVETDELFETGEYKASVRHVYKIVASPVNQPSVILISSEYMPEKDPEWIGHASATTARYCEP